MKLNVYRWKTSKKPRDLDEMWMSRDNYKKIPNGQDSINYMSQKKRQIESFFILILLSLS